MKECLDYPRQKCPSCSRYLNRATQDRASPYRMRVRRYKGMYNAVKLYLHDAYSIEIIKSTVVRSNYVYEAMQFLRIKDDDEAYLIL